MQKTEKTEAMSNKKVYELGFHFISTIPETEVPARFAELKELIQKLGGELISEQAPSLHMLAYQMRKKLDNVYRRFDQAYFGWVKFEAAGATAVELKKALDLKDIVLRFLIVTTVRENTLVGIKPVAKVVTKKPEGTPAPVVATKAPMSEEEMEKTIAELVA
ncbi:MAG: 30S ribosomal protein S6 [Patescibacteria group bacterium]